jgi:uncharacterized protein YcbX
VERPIVSDREVVFSFRCVSTELIQLGDRFRPNVVVKGGDPFVEDGWEEIVIGSHQEHADQPPATISLVSSSTRCLVRFYQTRYFQPLFDRASMFAAAKCRHRDRCEGQSRAIQSAHEISNGDQYEEQDETLLGP